MLLSSIEGNGQCLDGGAMFGHVPRVLWSQWCTPDSQGRIPLACRTLLIEFGKMKILCETGIGAFFDPKKSKRYGVQNRDSHQLIKNLAARGIKEEDINYVILSHLHFDHAGGLLPTYSEILKGKKDLCFPKAHYVVGERAFERACQPHLRDQASFVPGLTDQLKNSGRLIIIREDKLPGVLEDHLSFIFTDGHTPGQMHILLNSQRGQKIFFAGDIIPGKAWVHLPITMGYDRWPERLIEEKQVLYEQAEREKWLIFFTHDKDIACTRIRKNKKNHYESYDEKPVLQKISLDSL